MKKKLAVFDLDGTLFDTSEVNCQSYMAAAKEVGYDIDHDKFLKVFIGKNYKDFLPMFGVAQPADVEAIHEKKKRLYPEYLSAATINTSLFDIIRGISAQYIIALATTASKKNAEDILNCFGVRDLFEIFITQDDSCVLKPDPECYLKAMEKAGIGPENTIIFEDSKVGIEAGRRSGAEVYKVTKFTKEY